MDKVQITKTKYCKLWHNRFVVTLIILILICVIFSCIGWVLHVIFAQSATKVTVEIHTHVTLPPHVESRRSEFRNNTFVSMLHQHQLATNETNCWVCGFLPSSVNTGVPYIPLPFSFNGSCSAWWELSASWVLTEERDNPDVRRLGLHLYHLCWPDGKRVYGTTSEKSEYADRQTRSTDLYFLPSNKTSRKGQTFLVVSEQAPFCIKKGGSEYKGTSKCLHTVTLNGTDWPRMVPSRNTYFVCGNKAYTSLLGNWRGTCYITWLLPPTYIADAKHHLQKRGVVSDQDTSGQEAGDVLKGLLPFWGPIANSRDIRQLIRVVEATVNETAGALSNLTAELVADRLVTLQNRMVLDIILADRGGVCKLIGSSCCIYIPDNAPTVYQAISKLHKIAESIHQDEGNWSLMGWFWGLLSTWGWKILTFVGLTLAILFSCCLCLQCGPAICGLCATLCVPSPVSQKAENAKIMLQQQLADLMAIDVDSD